MSDSTAASIRPPAAPRFWFSVISGPAVWAIHAVAAYLLVPLGCASHKAALAMHAVSITALVVLVLLAVSARRKYKLVSRGSQVTEIDDWRPERWVPAACFILSCAFFLVILAQTIPTFIIEQCQ
jgi:uncharacterized sodium:solute symporter family permease YidK